MDNPPLAVSSHLFTTASESGIFASVQPILAQRLPQHAGIGKAHRTERPYAFESV